MPPTTTNLPIFFFMNCDDKIGRVWMTSIRYIEEREKKKERNPSIKIQKVRINIIIWDNRNKNEIERKQTMKIIKLAVNISNMDVYTYFVFFFSMCFYPLSLFSTHLKASRLLFSFWSFIFVVVVVIPS